MAVETWLAFLALALTFLITPGISHLLMLSNSLAYGARRSMATAAGDLSANTLQMLAAGLGLAAIITQVPAFFIVIKWAGVAYLVYLGLKLLFSGKSANAKAQTAISARQLFQQGFFTSASNPKAVVFFAALFPQFISPDAALAPQLTVLMLTYLTLDGTFLVFYGVCANFISKWIGQQTRRIDILSGVFILFAALLLSFKNMEA